MAESRLLVDGITKTGCFFVSLKVATFHALTLARLHGFAATAEALEEILRDLDNGDSRDFSLQEHVAGVSGSSSDNLARKLSFSKIR